MSEQEPRRGYWSDAAARTMTRDNLIVGGIIIAWLTTLLLGAQYGESYMLVADKLEPFALIGLGHSFGKLARPAA